MRRGGRHPDEHDLSLFSGGDLPFVRQHLVARHVAKCPGCAATVAAHASARAELRALDPVPEVDFQALAHRIRVEAAQTAPATPGHRGRLLAAGAGAGAAAAAVAVVMMLPAGGPTPTEGPRATTESAWPGPRLLHESADVEVTADGGLSVRSFHPGSGGMTITDYYAP